MNRSGVNQTTKGRQETFSDRVLQIVREIPVGTTRTYKEVATLAGRAKAYRAVGTILHRIWQTDRGKTVPCHRVIKSNGSLGGYAGGTNRKRQLLKKENLLELVYDDTGQSANHSTRSGE